jgi:uncharacterized membrane protein YfcA
MEDVLLVALAGFAASFVDGALGMGFGPTSSSILLSSGLNPAGVSATVNIAKVATGAVAAVSHWRFGNIDRRLVARLAIPGAIGALVGVTILANVDGDDLRPILAALLLLIGLRIFVRFWRIQAERRLAPDDANLRGVEAAGLVGGVTNGMIGAWGPVVTPFLLHRRVSPRIVIGSVNTAEIAVAVVAAGSLMTSSQHGVEPSTVLAMLIGGVIASPIAAYSIRHLPARLLGLLVAGLLLITNLRELAIWADVGTTRWIAYTAVVAAVTTAIVKPGLRPGTEGTSSKQGEHLPHLVVEIAGEQAQLGRFRGLVGGVDAGQAG